MSPGGLVTGRSTWARSPPRVFRHRSLGRGSRPAPIRLSLLVVIRWCFPDQGTRDPVDLLISERVVIILGNAVDGTRTGPALEQTLLPGSLHAAMFDDSSASAP